jgi:sec-independent protein translocase protein TatB
MPSLQDSAIIFILALLLFGPKKLPVLARELGKWIGEFRRASNEFKMQMEEELRLSEQAERQQKIAAMEAAAPATPALEGVPTEEPAHPHLDDYGSSQYSESSTYEAETAPLPIATSGDLNIMPPSTGLPVPQISTHDTATHEDLAPLLESIPAVDAPAHSESSVESAAHG